MNIQLNFQADQTKIVQDIGAADLFREKHV